LQTPQSTADFRYDPQGRRIRLERGSTLKTYFYTGLDLLSDGSSKFLYGTGIDEHLQADLSTGSVSYLGDHLGSTSQLLDSTNALAKARLDYKSYGKLEGDIANPAPANPFTYTGREDDGTGLMYYRARYYDPELEVFISQDPLGDAQRYVGGNPLSFVDPLGLDGVYVEFQGFEVTIPAGDYGPIHVSPHTKAPLGHAGVIAIDPKTGNSRFFSMAAMMGQVAKFEKKTYLPI
jgi:RHS repeat-associated protein